MLVIRSAQVHAFDGVAERDFIDRLARAVRAQHREALASRSDQALSAEIEGRVAQARAHGLTWEVSIADFVGLTYEVGPDFDQHPTVRAWLRDPAFAPDLRVERLVRELPPHTWSSVRAFTAAR